MDQLTPIHDSNGRAGAAANVHAAHHDMTGGFRPAHGLDLNGDRPGLDPGRPPEQSRPSDETNHARLAHLAINQEGFVFDPRTGESYVLNAVALAMLHGLQQGHGGEELTRALTERFDIDEATVRTDLGDFVAQLQRFQLL